MIDLTSTPPISSTPREAHHIPTGLSLKSLSSSRKSLSNSQKVVNMHNGMPAHHSDPKLYDDAIMTKADAINPVGGRVKQPTGKVKAYQRKYPIKK